MANSKLSSSTKQARIETGEYLAKRRKLAGLSQPQLEAEMGLPRGYISRVERGKLPMSSSHFPKLASLLGVKLPTLARQMLKSIDAELAAMLWPKRAAA